MDQGDPAWLAMRKRCVATCSVFGDALGVGYTSPHKLLRRKWGEEDEPEASWIMIEGQKREPYVRSLYLSMFPECDVELPTFNWLPGDERFGGSPDGIVSDGSQRWLLEVKTRPNQPELREEIPVTHLVQMLGLCKIYDLPFAHYICHTYNVGIQLARVEFDDALWTEVYRRLQMFALCFEKHIKPPKSDTKQFTQFIRDHTHITGFPELESKMQRLE